MPITHSKYHEAKSHVFPGAITLKVLLSGKDTDGSHAIFEDIVEPGVGPGRHIHHEQDETFFFLEGEFIAEIGGKMFEFKPGDIGFIPKGTVHAFKNVGTTQGRLQYMFSPALSIEEMFMSFYNALEDGSFSMEKMEEIATHHGQEFVGPPL